jgi:hypothetical protein
MLSDIGERAEMNQQLNDWMVVTMGNRSADPTFSQVHELLTVKGPGRAESSRGAVYRIEVQGHNIVAFPRNGRVTIHKDCWTHDITCQGTRAGGIYNGPYSIFDWYAEHT